MYISRRRILGAGLSAMLYPTLAPAAADDPKELALLSTQGRYAPLLKRAMNSGDEFTAQMRGQWGALVGDERLAFRDFQPLANPAVDLTGARAEPALAAIRAGAQGRRVVILNEAHIASRHRGFLSKTLSALRRDGFTHLAAETFANDGDSARLVERLGPGAPVTQEIGYYTCDPVFAEAVRDALRLGYKLFPYEERQDEKPPADSRDAVSVREAAQARNFLQQLARRPGARVVAYVGYSHLAETPDPDGNAWFALQLKRMAGIDPLTIDQAYPGSFGPHGKDSPLAAAILARFKLSEPVAVHSRSGDLLGRGPWLPDLAIFHPQLPDGFGRPGWLARDPARREVRVRLPIGLMHGGPIIAQAHHADEPRLSVPADQFVVDAATRTACFYLRPGRYRIRLERPDGFTPIRQIAVL